MPVSTIHALTAAFAKGEASPVAVTEAYLARIAALDGRVGAYLTVTRDEALTTDPVGPFTCEPCDGPISQERGCRQQRSEACFDVMGDLDRIKRIEP